VFELHARVRLCGNVQKRYSNFSFATSESAKEKLNLTKEDSQVCRGTATNFQVIANSSWRLKMDDHRLDRSPKPVCFGCMRSDACGWHLPRSQLSSQPQLIA
jgi:hypothetical protein